MGAKASDYLREISKGMTRFTPTPPDILGPFYLPNAPLRTTLSSDDGPLSLTLHGKVTNIFGGQIYGCLIEVWQADAAGVYDNDPAGPMNFRGSQITGQLGDYIFDTIVPGDYKISEPGQPDDFRCSHIHFKLTCSGYKELVTQLYFPNDPFNKTDHWFDARRVIQPPDATFDFVLETA